MPVHLPLVFLLLIFPLASWSAELTGRVVRIVDGDTLVILDASNTQHKIRLAGIDCPEREQPWGQRAKQALSDYVFNQQVTVEWTKLDRYKRVIGKILDGQQDVNLALVRDGMCWWYRKYAGEQSPVDRTLYEAAEAAARDRGWALGGPGAVLGVAQALISGPGTTPSARRSPPGPGRVKPFLVVDQVGAKVAIDPLSTRGVAGFSSEGESLRRKW